MASRQTATIYDIAKATGVNPSTVSRALTTPGRINPDTEKKIREAARSLNYRVNPMARALPTGRTKIFGLVVADITNPVFFKAVRGAEDLASQFGYTLLLAESQESSAQEAKVTEQILPLVDGIIMVTTRLSDKEIKELNREKPVVLMNRIVKGVTDVVPRLEPGIQDAIAHLKNLGHERIAYLGGPANSWMNQERWRLLMRASMKAGMSIVEIGPNAPTQEGGNKAYERVNASAVTAVVCYNDLVAIGLMRKAQSEGKNIPSDLSIIGFDNIFGSELTTPTLTTIELSLDRVGREAAKSLLGILEESDDDEILGNHDSFLVPRNSTSKARK